MRVDGVADVVSYGGLAREIHVQPQPSQLAAVGLTLADLETAIHAGSVNASGGILESGAEQFVIRLLPQDKARVGAFNDKIELDAAFTNDRDKLSTSIHELDFGNGTRLWDAVDVSLDALETVVGASWFAVELLPICPESLAPQQRNLPPAPSAQVC